MSAVQPSVSEVRALLAAASGRSLALLITRFSEDPRSGVVAAVAAARTRRDADRAERARTAAMYEAEYALHAKGMLVVVGVDEVGRGALAGPVTAAAVVLAHQPCIEGLDDSKRLTPKRREELATVIRAQAVASAVAHVSASEIDSVGMTAALRTAMRSAIAALGVEPDHVLLDGLPMRLHDHETAVVKGDGRIAAIAAASIVAKVTRDALMREYAETYPEYGFDINKGYGTAEHLDAISRVGLCPLHRRTFSTGGGTLPLF